MSNLRGVALILALILAGALEGGVMPRDLTSTVQNAKIILKGEVIGEGSFSWPRDEAEGVVAPSGDVRTAKTIKIRVEKVLAGRCGKEVQVVIPGYGPCTRAMTGHARTGETVYLCLGPPDWCPPELTPTDVFGEVNMGFGAMPIRDGVVVIQDKMRIRPDVAPFLTTRKPEDLEAAIAYL